MTLYTPCIDSYFCIRYWNLQWDLVNMWNYCIPLMYPHQCGINILVYLDLCVTTLNVTIQISKYILQSLFKKLVQLTWIRLN